MKSSQLREMEYRTSVSRPVHIRPSTPEEHAQKVLRLTEYEIRLAQLAEDGWASTRDAVSRELVDGMQWTTTWMLRPRREDARSRPQITIQQARDMVDRYAAAVAEHPPAGSPLSTGQEAQLDNLCYWRAVLAQITGVAP